jgi:WD40 repeat protein
MRSYAKGVHWRCYWLTAVCFGLFSISVLAGQEPKLRAILGETARMDGVRDLAFSPNSKLVASGYSDGRVRLWDVATAKEKAVLRGHRGMVESLAFSPDGKLLASGSSHGTIRLWEVAAAKEKFVLKRHTKSVRSVAFSRDGKLLASAEDRTVRLWDVAIGKQKAVLRGHRLFSMAFRPDGKLLTSGGSEGTVRLWDVQTRKGKKVALKGKVAENGRPSMEFSPDGKLVARLEGAYESEVRVWDVNTGKQKALLEWRVRRGGAGGPFAFSLDSKLLAAGDEDGYIHLFDLAAGKRNDEVAWHTGSAVGCLAFSPNGKLLATGGYDRVVRVWDLPGAQKPKK